MLRIANEKNFKHIYIFIYGIILSFPQIGKGNKI